jgi:hypothetical protein
MRRLILTPILLLLLFYGAPLQAHPLKVGRADITVRDAEVELLLSVNLLEMDLLLSLDRSLNARVEPEEIRAKQGEISAYLRERIRVTVGGEPLPVELDALRKGQSMDGKPTLEAVWFLQRAFWTGY